jgi:circadian clock protein KaiC
MRKSKADGRKNGIALLKCPTGITGFDEITLGGLPRGRPTLVCGGAGCGKTLFGVEFLVRGVQQFRENGVCISFEETGYDLARNVHSLGFDLEALVRAKKLVIDHIELDRSQIAETGEYNLEGLFIRIGAAIDAVGAKRVLIDTPEALFAGLSDEGILRAELRRLFAWLKSKGVTAVITGERGEGTLTRHGLEEYVSDCVVLLDHRVQNSIVTRRLRVLKYRGSTHGTNEYPFLVDESGISVLPVTSLNLEHLVSSERVSSGIPELDQMLEGAGFYRGTSILVSGSAGTGKTSIGAHFVNASCERGEPALYFTFEESPEQMIRNMASIGLDLRRWIKQGLLHIDATRPTAWGLEMHLVRMHKLIREYQPKAVVMDPLTSLIAGSGDGDVTTLVLRIVDYLKAAGATALFTTLTESGMLEETQVGLSSLVDSWLQLRTLEVNGERNRVLYVLKSRGTAHSNQVREFVLTNNGVRLQPLYLGSGGVLTGSARVAQEAREREEAMKAQQMREFSQAELERKMLALDAQLHALQLEKEARAREIQILREQDEERSRTLKNTENALAQSRSKGRDRHGIRLTKAGKG